MESEIINTLHSESINEIALALSKAQSEMKHAIKDSKVDFTTKAGHQKKYNYADLKQIVEASRKPLIDNGLAITQLSIFANEKHYCITMLVHSSGQWFKSIFPVVPASFDVQSIGSAFSYARRYSEAAICNVVTDDDDGQQAMPSTQQPVAQPERKQSEKETMIAKMNNAKSLIDLQSLIAQCPADWKTDAFDDFTKKLKAKFTSEIESELKEQFDAEEITPESLMLEHSITKKPKGATK